MRYRNGSRFVGAGFVFFLTICSPLRGAIPEGSIAETIEAEEEQSGIGLELYSWAYSNPFRRWDGKTAAADGSAADPIQITNQLTLTVPAWGPLAFEVTPQFVLQPFEGSRFQLIDPSIGVEGTFIETENFAYWARIETLVPIGESRDEGMVAGPQIVQSFEYSFPGTRFRAELSLLPRIQIYNNGELSSYLYVSPRVYYLVSDSFWLVSLIEVGLESERGQSLLALTETETLSLGLGIRYTANAGKGFWVQPFLNFFPAGDIVSNAHLGVFFGGPLL